MRQIDRNFMAVNSAAKWLLVRLLAVAAVALAALFFGIPFAAEVLAFIGILAFLSLVAILPSL